MIQHKKPDSSRPSVGVTYGPHRDARLGHYLGINPLSDTVKICSFDCVYCDLGPTQLKLSDLKKGKHFLDPEQLDAEIRSKLRALKEQAKNLDALCVSGNGEPTLYPSLPELTERLQLIRQELAPHCRLIILSNGAHLDQKKIIAALNKFDECMIKLDAGRHPTFKKVNRPIVRSDVDRVIAGVRQLDKVILQCMFVGGSYNNTQNDDVEEWMEAVGMIGPKEVHIYTLERPGAASGVAPVSEDTLEVIASKLRRRAGIEVKVFAAPEQN